MRCRYCGYEIPYGTNFCENCGAAADTAPDSNMQDVNNPMPPADNGYNNNNQYGGGQYGNNQYGNNQYGNNQYGNNQYGNNQYGNNQYGNNQYGNNQYGNNQYGNNQYGGNPYGNNQYGGNQYGYGQPVYNQGDGSPRYVGFVDAIKLFFKNYANFNGRSTRSEYWYVALFNAIISIGLLIIGSILAVIADSAGVFAFVYVLLMIYGVAIICPSIAVSIRRLHDMGKEGTWYLFCFVPYVESIFLIIWFCKPSVGPNQWGSPAAPK